MHQHLNRLTAHALCLATTLALTGCDGWNPFDGSNDMNEKAMNCGPIKPTQMHDLQQSLRAEPVYQVNKDQAVGEVHFELDIPELDLEAEAETLMFVQSAKVGEMVFAGPLKPRFSVQIDERLIKDGPGDSLEFRLLRFKQSSSCIQTQQVGDPVWQPGATVKVRFLRDRLLDKTTGVPIGFEVDVRKP